jgi:hypothetical protein
MNDPNVNPNFQVPVQAPIIRVPADDASIQETNAALTNLIALMGNPAQDGSILNVLQQLANFGAQPWVPNVLSAAANEVLPGITILGTPLQAFRVWGGYVNVSARTNNTYTGTDDFYGRVYVDSFPQLTVSHRLVAVAGPQQHDSGSNFVSIPGVPFPAGTVLKLDGNGNVGLGTTGVLRFSANIFYSIP